MSVSVQVCAASLMPTQKPLQRADVTSSLAAAPLASVISLTINVKYVPEIYNPYSKIDMYQPQHFIFEFEPFVITALTCFSKQ